MRANDSEYAVRQGRKSFPVKKAIYYLTVQFSMNIKMC